MKTRSAKAKGRRCSEEAKEMILKWFPDLQSQDIVVTPAGVNGPDLQFSPAASSALPLVVECKNQEALNIWAALKQAKEHQTDERPGYPAVIFKRNRSEVNIAMSFSDFLSLVGIFNADLALEAWPAKPDIN